MSLDQVAELPDLETLFTTEATLDEDTTFLGRLNSSRQERKPVVMQQLEVPDILPRLIESSAPNGESGEVVFFDRVVVGGTFDRLHAGHRLLLSVAAVISQKKLLIGITDDQYLLKKRYKQQIQALQARTDGVLAFVQSVRPGLEVDFSVMTDPKSPVVAETDSSFEAIVVSQETQSGGEKINVSRLQRGFPPLHVITVGLLSSAGHSKLSSTELRSADSQH